MLHDKRVIGLIIAFCLASSAQAILHTHRTLRNFYTDQLQHFAHIQQRCSGENAEIDQQGRIIKILCDVDATHMVLGCYTKNGLQIAQVVARDYSDFLSKDHACLATIQIADDTKDDTVITDVVARFCTFAEHKGYQRMYLTVTSKRHRKALYDQGFVDTQGCQHRGAYVLKKEFDQKKDSNVLLEKILLFYP